MEVYSFIKKEKFVYEFNYKFINIVSILEKNKQKIGKNFSRDISNMSPFYFIL